MTITINMWAIIISIFGSVGLGFLWYGPLFGKQWMALNGMVMPDPKPSPKVMIKLIIISLFGALSMSFVLAWFSALSTNPFATALMVWVGFIVPVLFNSAGWEGKSWKLFFINGGYWLVYLLGVATILSILTK